MDHSLCSASFGLHFFVVQVMDYAIGSLLHHMSTLLDPNASTNTIIVEIKNCPFSVQPAFSSSRARLASVRH